MGTQSPKMGTGTRARAELGPKHTCVELVAVWSQHGWRGVGSLRESPTYKHTDRGPGVQQGGGNCGPYVSKPKIRILSSHWDRGGADLGHGE